MFPHFHFVYFIICWYICAHLTFTSSRTKSICFVLIADAVVQSAPSTSYCAIKHNRNWPPAALCLCVDGDGCDLWCLHINSRVIPLRHIFFYIPHMWFLLFIILLLRVQLADYLYEHFTHIRCIYQFYKSEFRIFNKI